MKQFHGYWWPDAADASVSRYVRHADDMRVALRFTTRRSVAVQAGGHCGIWPLWLSRYFPLVHTFEPDPANYACLLRNLGATERGREIVTHNACLGAEATSIRMSVNARNTGGHKGTQEPGDTPVVTIDSLKLAACDLIVLDIEGMELPALKGAQDTLQRFRPTLMLEDRGHGDRHGWGGAAALFGWLAEHGYRKQARVSHDVVLTCAR